MKADDKNHELEIGVVFQLMAAQGMLSILPSEVELGGFVHQALKEIPAVDRCSICIRGQDRVIGDSSEPAEKIIEAMKTTPDHEVDVTIALPVSEVPIIYTLRTSQRTYGFVLLSTKPGSMFEELNPTVYNFVNVVAVDLERRRQKAKLDSYRNHLEESVNKRTIDLQAEITERKRAEEALLESEEEYRRLYLMLRLMSDNLPDLVWTKDLDGNFMFANRACCEVMLNAKDSDEPVGRSDMYFANRENQSHADNPDYHTFGEECTGSDSVVLETGKAIRTKESGYLKGSYVVFDVLKAPFWDDEGNLVGTVGCARDVTEEKYTEIEREKTQEELRGSEERFRHVVESAEEWIWEVDSTALYTYASPVVEKLLGYKPEELVGKKHSYDLFFPDHVEALKKETFELFAERKPLFRFLNRNVHKNGSTVWLSTNGVPFYDQEGRFVGYRGADIDVTERKQAEQELEKHREHLEDLVRERTAELRTIVKAMAGRENRMVGLKEAVKKLRTQLEETGMTPVADDPLNEGRTGK